MDTFSSSDVGLQYNTTHSTGNQDFVEFPESQAAKIIWKIFTPPIILLGALGNIATIVVMRRIKDHNSAQHAIFMALAVSDFTLLCTSTTMSWIREVFHVDVKVLHIAACKMLTWMVYVSGTMSAWLVTFVTVQRTMAVLWPHRMRVLCTLRRTWIVIVTLVLTACALDFHFLLGLEINENNMCRPVQGAYKQFADFIFSLVDSCVVSFFPSVCMFVCDIILSVTLFKAVSSSSIIAARVDSNVSAAHNTDTRRTTSYRTTVMVLAISCAFLVLTTPLCVCLTWLNFAHTDIIQYPQTVAMFELLFAVSFELWYTNSAVNFLLYCLTGTRFRGEFMRWIRCGAQSPSAPPVHETASGASRRGRHKHHGNSPLSK